jgi:hypothetical protein
MEGSVNQSATTGRAARHFETVSKDAFTWLLDSSQRTRLPLIYE